MPGGLIIAFLLHYLIDISYKYPGINLVLIGAADTLKEEMMLKKSVTRLNLDNRVVFLGKMARTDIPVYLSLIHISEPTRQAEISYAVFCLKKKKNTKYIKD